MKCSSGSSDGGDDPRTPAPADAVGGESSEPSKKQRTEEPSASSSGAGECSSSFPLAPPEHSSPSGEEGQARVPDLGEDLVFEVLMRAEARTLASAACVSRAWRQLASDERLWEATCVREWVSIGYSEQMLRRVVLRLGGFRRLHELYIRPIQQQRRGAGPRMLQVPARINRDQLQVSLSLLSTSFFQNMPSAPPAPKKKDKDNDNNGGGKCG